MRQTCAKPIGLSVCSRHGPMASLSPSIGRRMMPAPPPPLQFKPIGHVTNENTEFLVNMSASADVLAMAKVEVDLNAIPEGKNVSYLGITPKADPSALPLPSLFLTI